MKTSLSNLVLIAIGLLFLSIGLWRTIPIDLSNPKFWKGSWPMIMAFMVTISTAIWVGGTKGVIEGADQSIGITARYLLTLMLLFPIMGFSIPILKHFESEIVMKLQGPFGYLWTFLCSLLSPSSTAFGPLVRRLFENHPALRPMLMYFLTVVPQISLSIFVFRSMGLGNDLGYEMYKLSFIIGILLMPCFWFYGKFLYKIPQIPLN